MKNYKNIIRLFLLGCLLWFPSYFVKGQVSINFSPVIYGQSLDGLVYAQVVNSYSSDLKAVLTIRVRENRVGNVVTIKTPVFILKPGINEINKAAFNNARFAFGNNNFGLTASQTGRFLEGEYEYCYEVDISESKQSQLSPVYENCFIQQLQPRTPLLLINPVDGEEFCNQRPQFTWQPPMPLPRDARCRLVLTEVKEKQDIVEAITYNTPIVNQANIAGNTLFYPASAPALKEDHRYAWQVIVYAARTILARSEVWTFTLHCNQEKPVISSDSYRELKETGEGGFYTTSQFLRFSFINPYAAGKLNYSVTSMSDPSKPIKRLPELKLAAGLNKYDIDLSDNRSFKKDQEYLLTIRLPNNRKLTLRFIYKNE